MVHDRVISQASHRKGPISIPGQYICDFVDKVALGSIFLWVLRYFKSVVIPPAFKFKGGSPTVRVGQIL
jgi:hypothetical protein